MKRKFLVVLLVLAIMLQMLSGCGLFEKEDAQDQLTRGELLDMICDEFGMYDYSSGTPYIASVPTDDPHFASVQKCVEWGIISADDQNYDVNAPVDREELAQIVTSAGNLMDSSASGEECIQFAVSHNLVQTDRNGNVDLDEAIQAVTGAQELWAHPVYDGHFNYELNDEIKVVNTGDILSSAQGEVVLSSEVAAQLKPGDVYLYPDETGMPTPHRVAQLESSVEGVRIVNSTEAVQFEEVFETLDYAQNIAPDFSQSYITDGAGNVISSGIVSPTTYYDSPSCYATNLANASAPAAAHKLGLFNSREFSFKVDDIIISGKMSGDSISFTAKGKLDTKGSDASMSFSASYELSDFNIDAAVDYGLVKGLQSARLSLDYTTKKDIKFSTSLTPSSINNPGAYGSTTDYGDFLGTVIKNVAYDNSVSGFNYDGEHSKGASKTIGIARIETPLNVSIARIVIEIKLEISLNGSIQLIVKTHSVNGVEYQKGSGLRAIKNKSVDTDLQLKASLEALVYAGVVANCCSFNIIDVGVKGGIGCSIASTAHLADYTIAGELAIQRASADSKLPGDFMEAVAATQLGGTLKVETCTEAKAYFILRITAGDNSILGKITKLNIEVFGEKDKEIWSAHIEDGRIVEECTRKYRTEEDETEKEDTAGASDANRLDLVGGYVLTLNGASKILEITPESAVDPSQVVWTSTDPSIATVNQNGEVAPISTGITSVIASLKDDPSVQVQCTVIVQSIGESNWEFLPADMAVA